jgi:hypothetical protein
MHENPIHCIAEYLAGLPRLAAFHPRGSFRRIDVKKQITYGSSYLMNSLAFSEIVTAKNY